MKKYSEFMNEATNDKRITYGPEEIYQLNNDEPKFFVTQFRHRKEPPDVFFTNDGYATVTGRGWNLTSHAEDKGKYIRRKSEIKFVYASHEDEFYTLEDYLLLLRAIYMGTRVPKKVQPLHSSKLK